MDGIANVVEKQQNTVQTKDLSTALDAVKQELKPVKKDLVKEIQKEISSNEVKIDSKEQMQDLVDALNKAMAPISTNLSFGVDKDNVFFVSVRETVSNRLIRRFPAEQAVDFLPKMQEVIGILFDTKG